MKTLARKSSVRSAAREGASKETPHGVATNAKPLITHRAYQRPVFLDRTTGTELLHWSRQIGKSKTLGDWAFDRCLSRPGRLITVLSNSKDNGGEFAVKVAETSQTFGQAFELVAGDAKIDAQEIRDVPFDFEAMRFEFRMKVGGKTSRVKILAANPRTARGFSGDLIMDEFAFHENSAAIWEAAEPILSSNQDFLCRVASTGNGKHNMFYRMASGGTPFVAPSQALQDGSGDASPKTASASLQTLFVSDSGFLVSRVPRSLAWKMGVKIFDANTRESITPDQARARAMDKRAYDQNYECQFADENMALLTHELISAAEADNVGVVCEQDWTGEAQDLLLAAQGDLFVGVDVGRNRDLTVMTVVERLGVMRFVRAILRIEGMRLPQQQERLGFLCRLPKFRRAAIDMTGIGLGLTEYSQDAFGRHRVHGINFSLSVPITQKILDEGRKAETVRVTEAMATELLQVYEDRHIQHPRDGQLRDSLRKPEKITSPGGRVSIAATRTEAGHADEFWSFALAEEAGSTPFDSSCERISRFGNSRSSGGTRSRSGRDVVMC